MTATADTTNSTEMTDVAQRRRLELKPLITRLVACLAGGVVLALMWGEQEGTQDDYGFAFHQAVFKPRILVFLGIGLVAFLAITFWPKVRPFLTRPGMPSYLAGVATVIASYVLLHWYDPISGQKLSSLSDLVGSTSSGVLSPVTFAFFGWLHWTALLVLLAVRRLRDRQRSNASSRGSSPGSASSWQWWSSWRARTSSMSAARPITRSDPSSPWPDSSSWPSPSPRQRVTKEQVASTRSSVDRFLNIIPGMPLVVGGLVLGLLACTIPDWFSPLNLNTTFSDMFDLFDGSGVSGLASPTSSGSAGCSYSVARWWQASAPICTRRCSAGSASGLAVVTVLITLYVLYDDRTSRRSSRRTAPRAVAEPRRRRLGRLYRADADRAAAAACVALHLRAAVPHARRSTASRCVPKDKIERDHAQPDPGRDRARAVLPADA